MHQQDLVDGLAGLRSRHAVQLALWIAESEDSGCPCGAGHDVRAALEVAVEGGRAFSPWVARQLNDAERALDAAIGECEEHESRHRSLRFALWAAQRAVLDRPRQDWSDLLSAAVLALSPGLQQQSLAQAMELAAGRRIVPPATRTPTHSPDELDAIRRADRIVGQGHHVLLLRDHGRSTGRLHELHKDWLTRVQDSLPQWIGSEQDLCAALGTIGTVVAVGPVSLSGRHVLTLDVPDDHWRAVVRHLMSTARAVVHWAPIGSTGWTLWEVETALTELACPLIVYHSAPRARFAEEWRLIFGGLSSLMADRTTMPESVPVPAGFAGAPFGLLEVVPKEGSLRVLQARHSVVARVRCLMGLWRAPLLVELLQQGGQRTSDLRIGRVEWLFLVAMTLFLIANFSMPGPT